MYNKLRESWAKARALSSASHEPYIPTSRSVYVSKATKQLLRQAYHHNRKLMREKKTRDRLKWFWDEKELHKWVNDRQEQRKIPRIRVRDRYNLVTEKAPPVTQLVYGRYKAVSPGYFYWGSTQNFEDYHPSKKGEAPLCMNPANGARYVVNSLSCSMTLKHPIQYLYFPKGKWATNGRWISPVKGDISLPLTFVDAHAQRALQLAYVDMKSPDIAMNEYAFEFKQFMNLLKDPIKTLLKHQRLLKKWFDADAWMYRNPVQIRRFGKGVLKSVATPGSTLMSFRTKKEVSVFDVSLATVHAAANRWLQYRYGILPLYMDVGAVIGMLAVKPIENDWSKAEARFHVSRSKTDVVGSRTWGPTVQYFEGKRMEGLTYSAKVYYKLLKKLPHSYSMGLHPSQILRALWNATPYSFVADWVANVDDWLVAGTSLPNSYIGRNCVTAKEYEKVVLQMKRVTSTSSPNWILELSSIPTMLAVREKFNRHVDVPFLNELTLSSKWHSFKNAMTAEALLATHGFKKQRRTYAN